MSAPSFCEALQVLVDGPHADGAAAGQRDARDAGPREQRAQDEHGRAHGRDELVGRLVARDARHAHPGDAVGVGRDLAAEPLEERAGGHDVGERRDIVEHHGLGREERGAQRGQARVLGRAHRHLPAKRAAAFDDQTRGHQQAAPETAAPGAGHCPPI